MMEQLDAVYNAFTKLETNYKRSKKTRKEYLADKFGGDIEIGMMVILDYFAGVTIEGDEDIKKLSKIKDIFAAIKRNIGMLDTLSSFDELLDTGDDASITMLLDAATTAGSGITYVPTDMLRPNYHYRATSDGLLVVPLLCAKQVKVFNESMKVLVQSMLGSRGLVSVGQLYDQEAQGVLKLHKSVYG